MFAGQIRRASDGVRGLERAHRQGRARAHDEEFTVDRAQLHTPEQPRSGPLRRVPPGGGRCVVAGRMSARRSAPERARRRGERWPGIVSGRVREQGPRRACDEVRVTGPCVTTAGTQARGRRATWRPHGTCAAPRRERVAQTAAATVGGAPRKMNECLRNPGRRVRHAGGARPRPRGRAWRFGGRSGEERAQVRRGRPLSRVRGGPGSRRRGPAAASPPRVGRAADLRPRARSAPGRRVVACAGVRARSRRYAVLRRVAAASACRAARAGPGPDPEKPPNGTWNDVLAKFWRAAPRRRETLVRGGRLADTSCARDCGIKE